VLCLQAYTAHVCLIAAVDGIARRAEETTALQAAHAVRLEETQRLTEQRLQDATVCLPVHAQ